MEKKIKLFEENHLTVREKFFKFMDLLVQNKITSLTESLIYLCILNVQLLCGYYSYNLVFLEEEHLIDKLLNTIYLVLRLESLIISDFSYFSAFVYFNFFFLLFFIGYFLYAMFKMNINSLYSVNEKIVNALLKFLLYVILNCALDANLTVLLGEKRNLKTEYRLSEHPFLGVIAAFNLVFLFGVGFMTSLYYNDSNMLSKSPIARVNCGMEQLFLFNNFVYSALFIAVDNIGRQAFCLYNLVSSIFLLYKFYYCYPYFNHTVTLVQGVFHLLHLWTAIFFFLLQITQVNGGAIIYLLGVVIIIYVYKNTKSLLEDRIIMDTPFHKLKNPYHVIYYIHNLAVKYNDVELNIEDKAFIIGIIKQHATECPSPNCYTKKKIPLYLPIDDQWSLRDKNDINDKVFIYQFFIQMMKFFVDKGDCRVDLMINLSLYYLELVGNYSEAIFMLKTIENYDLTYQEEFSLKSLQILIQEKLSESLKPSYEGATKLEELNVSLFFKYQHLCNKMTTEIEKDVTYTTKFWNVFKDNFESYSVDLNQVFDLTDKIRETKEKIKNDWYELFSICNRVNAVFEIYMLYEDLINDDEKSRKELENFKLKNVSMGENLTENYYERLFDEKKGMIIISGNFGKEGLIEKINQDAASFFEYQTEELKGVNINTILPKVLADKHKGFISKYIEIGEKKRIDREMSNYGKDRSNHIVSVTLYIKLFPILSDTVYFSSLVEKRTLDDAIMMDENFFIQGLCSKLAWRLGLRPTNMFQAFNIPFYLICTKFVNLYKKFFREGEHMGIDLDKFEVSENAEMEFEITLPRFFLEFIERQQKQNNKLQRSATLVPGLLEDEDEAMLKKQVYQPKAKITEEEKAFKHKIDKLIGLFQQGKFDDLTTALDNLKEDSIPDSKSKEQSIPTMKFNFVFWSEKYGKNNRIFLARFISNKTDDIQSYENSSENFIEQDHQVIKKNKIDMLNSIYTMTEEGVENFEANQGLIVENFEEPEYKKLLSEFTVELQTKSKIFGVKRANEENEKLNVDIESGSQSSTSYNENLSQSTRVKEIRSNIMKNIDRFFTFKWINVSMLLSVLTSLVFVLVFMMQINSTSTDLENITQLNNDLFNVEILSVYVITDMISLRAVFQNTEYEVNTFTGDQAEYIKYLKERALDWSDSADQSLRRIESWGAYYLKEVNLWENTKMDYQNDLLREAMPDSDPYTFSLNRVLIAANHLAKAEYFGANKTLSSREKREVEYYLNLAIFNPLNHLYETLNALRSSVPDILKEYVENDRVRVIITLTIYMCGLFICYGFYLFLLFKTNLHMQSGIEKLKKINKAGIEEVLKKIDSFRREFSSLNSTIDTSIFEDRLDVLRMSQEQQRTLFIKNNVNAFEYSKPKQPTKKIGMYLLYSSFYQVAFLAIGLFGFLTPIYFIFFTKINDFQNFIQVEDLILGSAKESSVRVLKTIKTLNGIDTKFDAEYAILTEEVKDKATQKIKEFDLLQEFYYKQYLTDICSVTSTNEKCKDEDYINANHNAEGLYIEIEDNIRLIELRSTRDKGRTVQLKSGRSSTFKPEFMLESEFFKDIEEIFYEVTSFIPPAFIAVTANMMTKSNENMAKNILTLSIFYLAFIVFFAVFVVFYYKKKLIRYISISRCIIKIVPVSIINNTTELENWIERNYK